jgi:hypothetical protein
MYDMGKRFAFAVTSLSLFVATRDVGAAAPEVVEATAIEIAPPPEHYGTDAATLSAVVADELRSLERPTGSPKRVVVSLALAPLTEQQECMVDATLRDARTGTVVAVIETATRASGDLTPAQRTALAHAAVRRTVRRVPSALSDSDKSEK